MLLQLPDIGDEDHQECWMLAQDQALRKSERAMKGRSLEQVVEDTYNGLVCERVYFRSLGEDWYQECVARQEVEHASYGSDSGDIDVKSTLMKYGPRYDYTLSVPYENLKRDKETKRYALVVKQELKRKTVFYYAGWATSEEILNSTNELFYGKPNLKISQLHPPESHA